MSEPHKNTQRKRVNISHEAKQALLYNLKEEQVKYRVFLPLTYSLTSCRVLPLKNLRRISSCGWWPD